MNEREVLTLSEQEARDIVYENTEDFLVVSDDIDDTSRWAVQHTVIVQRVVDLKHFRSFYSVGATESQDQRAYEYDECTFTEVFPVSKTITIYE